MQQILSRDPELSVQVLRVDPNAPMPTSSQSPEEAYVPPLVKVAQLPNRLRASCVMRLGFGDIYPNPYYLWVAPTTYYQKSTGLNAITDIVRDTMPHLLLPATNSPEMLVAKLAGEKPSL